MVDTKEIKNFLNLSGQIIKGVESAQKSHRKMSCVRFGEAPEYLVTTKIGEELAKKFPGCINMEPSVVNVLLGAKSKGKKPTSGKFDIVLNWKNEAPRAIVEVKHPGRHANQLVNDAARIGCALTSTKEHNLLRVGYLAFYSQTPASTKSRKNAEDLIEKKSEQIIAGITKNLDKWKCTVMLKQGKFIKDKGTAKNQQRWGRAFCLVLKRAKET